MINTISWSDSEGFGTSTLTLSGLPIVGGGFSMGSTPYTPGIEGTFGSTTSCSGSISYKGTTKDWTATLTQ